MWGLESELKLSSVQGSMWGLEEELDSGMLWGQMWDVELWPGRSDEEDTIGEKSIEERIA
jgi:hypothetical protein